MYINKKFVKSLICFLNIQFSAHNFFFRKTLSGRPQRGRRGCTTGLSWGSTISSAALFLLFTAIILKADEFPTPEIIKPNVAFWKKIYTEVSLTEGLLHDKEYPMIIYKKVTIGKATGRRRTNIIRKYKKQVEASLTALNTLPETEWSSQEREIQKMFLIHASEKELRGADNRIRFQQGQKERYLEGIRRSGMYMDTIRAIFKEYNIPMRLCYLPHVESSFDYRAYSKVGAAGLWQFMRGTGKEYLKINYLVDERRDPIYSTVAAAKLLSHNYRQLQAWPLAITAYNHGLYGMKRAVKRTGSRNIEVILQKHKSSSFKFASKNFYSCFIAASEIAAEPEKYFGTIPYHPKFYANTLTLTHYIRPAILSTYLGVSQKQLRELNPALRPVVFSAQKLIPEGFQLRIPATLPQAKALQMMAAIPDSLLQSEPELPSYYRVRRGDNLYKIAYRFGVTARDLALENNISRMNRIYAGQVLQIPGRGTKKPAVKKVKAPLKVASGKDTKEKTAMGPLKSLSDKDSIDEIAAVPADTIPRGVPAGASGGFYKFDGSVYNFEVEEHLKSNRAIIRISVNETIGHYADWLGIPTWRIRRLNGLRGHSTIRIDRRLIIPIQTQEDLLRFNQRRIEYHMALEEDFFSQFKVADIKNKKIRRGENLWDICNSEGEIPLWLFKKYNPQLDFARLIPGSIARIPVIAEKTAEDFALEMMGDEGLYPANYEPLRGFIHAPLLIP